jgi:hypothetical protein
MKVFKLKKLPVYRDDGTTIERRIKDLEAVINMLSVIFTEKDGYKLPKEATELFDEVPADELLN